MFTEKDLNQIKARGITPEAVEQQIENFRQGFPFLGIVRAASPADGVVVVDARSKRPNVGKNPSRFPNVVASSEETIELVDSRWSEYGMGDMLPSPSARYRVLLFPKGDQWVDEER